MTLHFTHTFFFLLLSALSACFYCCWQKQPTVPVGCSRTNTPHRGNFAAKFIGIPVMRAALVGRACSRTIPSVHDSPLWLYYVHIYVLHVLSSSMSKPSPHWQTCWPSFGLHLALGSSQAAAPSLGLQEPPAFFGFGACQEWDSWLI